MAVEKWRKYECLMIFDPELGPEPTEELIQRARDFVTQESGRILKSERWGLRDLAFELKGRRRGYYLILTFAGLPRCATELDRRLNLIDAILKFQTIKVDDEIDPATLPDEEVEEVAPEPAPAEAPAKPVAERSGRKSVVEDDDEDDDADSDDDTDEDEN